MLYVDSLFINFFIVYIIVYIVYSNLQSIIGERPFNKNLIRFSKLEIVDIKVQRSLNLFVPCDFHLNFVFVITKTEKKYLNIHTVYKNAVTDRKIFRSGKFDLQIHQPIETNNEVNNEKSFFVYKQKFYLKTL